MKAILGILVMTLLSNPIPKKKPVVDFNIGDAGREWYIVNDDVMGGVSAASGDFTEQGNLHWYGEVSLENNGGFVSLRSPEGSVDLGRKKGLKIRMKGDGRNYGFTMRDVTYFNGISYTYYWPTKPGEWMEVEVPFSKIEGCYFGKPDPRVKPFAPETIKEVGVILYDGNAGAFDVEIDWIDVY